MTWTDNILLNGLTDSQLKLVQERSKPIVYEPNETIIEEKEEAEFLFLIFDGEVIIYKSELRIGQHKVGGVVGLMSLIDNSTRSARVEAGPKGASGYIIEKQEWEELPTLQEGKLLGRMLQNYLPYQQIALRHTNELSLSEERAKLDQEKRRMMAARFFAQMSLGLVIFTFVFSFLNESSLNLEPTYISFAVLLIYGIWSAFYVRTCGLPLETFGISTHNFKTTFSYIMRATLVAVILLFLIKWVMITWFADRYGNQLIEFYQPTDNTPAWLIAFLYALHSIVQEFIARGCIQSGLHQFLTGKGAAAMAIVLATLMFASFHVILNLQFALFTIIPGLFWGYLFYKQRNIWAISISHIVIGLVAIFLLNMIR